MENIVRGMMVWSLAGHDTGKLYVIIATDEQYVYLADGKIRQLESPKKKKRKHIQVMKQIPKELAGLDWSIIKNEDIKRAVKLMSK